AAIKAYPETSQPDWRLSFLFAVGMELDMDRLRHRAYTAVVVSHASIMFPYFLGVVASLTLYSRYAAPHVSFIPFALFMGIAMSITAFPSWPAFSKSAA